MKFNQSLVARGLLTIFIAAFLGACVSMPPNDQQQSSFALSDTNTTRLGMNFSTALAPNKNSTGVLLLFNGLDAFVARAALADVAEKSLDVQYYLFHRDLSGRLLLNQLLKAADRGVRVRLLVDDMDMADTDLGVAILDAHPNMEVRLFNPFARDRNRTGQLLSRFGSVTRRMHNKSFTADNQITIVGGRNVGNEYFEADPSIAFADMDALLAGPAAKEVSKSFDLYWNNALSYTVGSLGEPQPSERDVMAAREQLAEWVSSQESSVYVEALMASDLSHDIREKRLKYDWAKVDIYYDQPEKISAGRDQTHLHMSPKLQPFFGNAQEEVLIISPYFVPGKEGTAKLCELSNRGVSVQVITNSLASTDVSVVHAGYIRYRKKLLTCGVQIFESNSKLLLRDSSDDNFSIAGSKKGKKLGQSRTSLHAKMFVFDRQHTFIGSLNLDPRSVTENTEIGAIIDSAEIGEKVASAILERIPKVSFTLRLDENGKVWWDGFEEGEPVSYATEPHTGFFKRMGTQVMRIMPIESQI